MCVVTNISGGRKEEEWERMCWKEGRGEEKGVTAPPLAEAHALKDLRFST